MLTRMWSSEARGSTCASTAVGRCISHVLVNSRPTGHNSLCPVGLRERLAAVQRLHVPPRRGPATFALILATLKRGPGECKEEKLTRGHIRKPRDFLDMALCERLSVLCGVIAQSRAFKPSDGHTALPCGLLQLSPVARFVALSVPFQPSPCVLFARPKAG